MKAAIKGGSRFEELVRLLLHYPEVEIERARCVS